MTKLKSNATVFEALNWASLCLQKNNLEANGARYLMLDQMNWDETNLLLHYRQHLSESEQKTFETHVHRLLLGEPAQYITGNAYFYGFPFYVNQNVLIPRPETEELVEWILRDHLEPQLKVLDIGTGSGAIAITLKKHRPNWKITASDISSSALQVAKQNAELNGVSINFQASDLFKQIKSQNFDVIVSNPPYISTDEVKYMDQSVIQYEPQQALFAQHEGLLLYERLADSAKSYLVNNGDLYLEIGFQQGKAVKSLLERSNSFAKIELQKDLAEHDRMIKMTLKGDN
ncbi:protein-(glutamine-N5) methyltransferase, release factor-specific [Fructilactobacillus lindneri]|nr:peptide chain release factor N(5)-glutamine methyltransferase [Fructilactobacillus lindneri]POG98912.1 protein-(glutamine-N5) methyltransferase, release factor-specific [Fructilactobacillus lindneri]POH04299.1 protein-(glutamine-N5) methyltransferase, release factor-specific [Fructilactobacillus lindneri]POH04995.1 protein-(glutamine-N5) methyltransferase, release factor-specific [Fructilactobacillus lindneri]POH08002.1 protein-(glutamine-N5) methyltransferase, release factor-specific [Fruct